MAGKYQRAPEPKKKITDLLGNPAASPKRSAGEPPKAPRFAKKPAEEAAKAPGVGKEPPEEAAKAPRFAKKPAEEAAKPPRFGKKPPKEPDEAASPVEEAPDSPAVPDSPPEAPEPPVVPDSPPEAPESETPKLSVIVMILVVLKNVLVGLVGAVAVCMMIFTLLSVILFDRSDRDLFGYRAFIVLSDSMSATDFEAGDLVLVKTVDPFTLQEGDIIAFSSQNSENFGQTVTHKIRAKTTDAYGSPAFITYGTTTDTNDETPVPYSNVLGKFQRSLPKVGRFFQFLRTGPGYFLFIGIPFALLIAYQGLQSARLFRQEKKEEMDKVRAEQAAVAAEREEMRQMLMEMKRLQEQLLHQWEKKP